MSAKTEELYTEGSGTECAIAELLKEHVARGALFVSDRTGKVTKVQRGADQVVAAAEAECEAWHAKPGDQILKIQHDDVDVHVRENLATVSQLNTLTATHGDGTMTETKEAQVILLEKRKDDSPWRIFYSQTTLLDDPEGTEQ